MFAVEHEKLLVIWLNSSWERIPCEQRESETRAGSKIGSDLTCFSYVVEGVGLGVSGGKFRLVNGAYFLG